MNDQAVLPQETRKRLISSAIAARARAYAPYSHFAVGAAIVADTGRIFTGVNIENASYGLTVCAERTAVGTMIAEGDRRILAVAVCSQNGVTPCGACRQVLSEFVATQDDIPVWMINAEGDVRETTLFALLPDNFGPESLG